MHWPRMVVPLDVRSCIDLSFTKTSTSPAQWNDLQLYNVVECVYVTLRKSITLSSFILGITFLVRCSFFAFRPLLHSKIQLSVWDVHETWPEFADRMSSASDRFCVHCDKHSKARYGMSEVSCKISSQNLPAPDQCFFMQLLETAHRLQMCT